MLPFYQVCLQHAASTAVSGNLSKEILQNLFCVWPDVYTFTNWQKSDGKIS